MLICFFFISCNEIDSNVPMEFNVNQNLDQEIQQMKNFYNNGLDLVVDRLGKDPYTHVQNSDLNVETIVTDILQVFNDNIYSMKDVENENYSLAMQKLFSSKNSPSSRTSLPNLNGESIFNAKQMDVASPFIHDLLEVDNPYTARNISISFEKEILNSSLNYEEKISLLSLSSGTHVVSDFIINDGINKIRDKIYTGQNPDFQTTGCSINMRSVMADAVVGFAGGALAGCYAGATAGTVAFPIVGTVTGCVSAGMVGGAGGFLTGATYSIASGLLLTCFR